MRFMIAMNKQYKATRMFRNIDMGIWSTSGYDEGAEL